MLKDFDTLKSQLSELADIINKFKSEAVQLRIVELVLQGRTTPSSDLQVKPPALNTQPPRKKHAKPKKSTESQPANSDAPKKKATAGAGAKATLTKVYSEGFFKSARTINDILAHCETNLARRIKANEISGKLARMVRSNELKRVKNSDGQYEYTST